MKVEIEQTLIDDLKVLHGIDTLAEINEAIRKNSGEEAEIIITNKGDKVEN
jgi:hypothetical protein